MPDRIQGSEKSRAMPSVSCEPSISEEYGDFCYEMGMGRSVFIRNFLIKFNKYMSKEKMEDFEIKFLDKIIEEAKEFKGKK